MVSKNISTHVWLYEVKKAWRSACARQDADGDEQPRMDPAALIRLANERKQAVAAGLPPPEAPPSAAGGPQQRLKILKRIVFFRDSSIKSETFSWKSKNLPDF